MNGVKIKDISGLLIEKDVHCHVHHSERGVENCAICHQIIGNNLALTEQVEKRIGLNREKLAICLWHYGIYAGIYGSWDNTPKAYKDIYFSMADAIIANQADILEVVE